MTLIPNPKYIYPNTTAINYFDKYYIFFIGDLIRWSFLPFC